MSLAAHVYNDNSGFFSLEGEDIKNGEIDIQSARNVIEGTQFALGYMLKSEDSTLLFSEDVNYPVSVRNGCWELIIPFGTYIGGLASGVLTTGVNAYAKKTGEKIADNQFGKKESKEIFENAFRKLQAVIKISQHLGVVDRRKPLNTKIKNHDSVLLINRDGNVLSTTMEEIDVYLSCPENLLRSLATAVTDYRTLSIGYKKMVLFTYRKLIGIIGIFL
jgi:hypothetical protein